MAKSLKKDRESLEKILATLNKTKELLSSDKLNGMFTFAYVHGYRYNGPQVDINNLNDSITLVEAMISEAE